jgi:hypothetical protein
VDAFNTISNGYLQFRYLRASQAALCAAILLNLQDIAYGLLNFNESGLACQSLYYISYVPVFNKCPIKNRLPWPVYTILIFIFFKKKEISYKFYSKTIKSHDIQMLFYHHKRNDSVKSGLVKKTRPDFRHFTPAYYHFIALSDS